MQGLKPWHIGNEQNIFHSACRCAIPLSHQGPFYNVSTLHPYKENKLNQTNNIWHITHSSSGKNMQVVILCAIRGLWYFCHSRQHEHTMFTGGMQLCIVQSCSCGRSLSQIQTDLHQVTLSSVLIGLLYVPRPPMQCSNLSKTNKMHIWLWQCLPYMRVCALSRNIRMYK